MRSKQQKRPKRVDLLTFLMIVLIVVPVIVGAIVAAFVEGPAFGRLFSLIMGSLEFVIPFAAGYAIADRSRR